MDEQTNHILDTVPVGALATIDSDGAPRVTPLHFARYENGIIWVSDDRAIHSVNVQRAESVQFVVWDEQKRAVYLTTTVSIVPESMRAAVEQAYRSKLGNFMPRVVQPQWYYVPIGQRDEETTVGNWVHYIA